MNNYSLIFFTTNVHHGITLHFCIRTIFLYSYVYFEVVFLVPSYAVLRKVITMNLFFSFSISFYTLKEKKNSISQKRLSASKEDYENLLNRQYLYEKRKII